MVSLFGLSEPNTVARWGFIISCIFLTYFRHHKRATSGAMTISMQRVLELRALGSRRLFSREFNIPEDLLMEVDNGSKCFLKDRRLANLDEYDPQYMSNTGKLACDFSP